RPSTARSSMMTRRLISHLRYLALSVPDFDAEHEFLTKHWGLTEVATDTADGGRVAYLAAEGSPEPYVIRLREGGKRIDLISYGARDRADVEALHPRLADAGTRIVHPPKPLDQHGGGYGFRFFDVDGRTIQTSPDVELRENRRIQPREPIP